MRLTYLNALRALEASVRLGSFRAAGEELGVTAAAVGQQVRKLEEAMGCVLLMRGPNGFEPTELAMLAAQRLTSGFAALQDALSLMQRSSTALRLAISVVPTIAERWLAPRLPGFLVHHPGIDLRIDSTHRVLSPASSEFDFAIRYAPPSPNAEAQLELFREWLLPVCAPELLTRLRPEDRSSAFQDVPLLHVDVETSDPEWIDWNEWGRRFDFAIPNQKQGFKFSRTTLALRSMYEGHGLHLAQLSITLPDLAAGRLVAPFGPETCVRTGYPYRLVAFGNNRRSTLHEAFVGWLKAEAGRTQEAIGAYLD